MARAAPTSLEKHVVYMPSDYKLEEILGSGTFSEVYRATHKATHKIIALKIFRHKMRTMSNYKSAAKEIAVMEILEHPNILQLNIYEINKIYVYIGTEFAAYGCFKNYLRDRKPLAEPIIKHVMQQLLSALSYLHEMGIFHGDVKPENILCTQMSENGPVIKICDFGLSEIKLKTNENMFYKSGSFLYMAPEVHLRYPVDCSCDLWSAGIIMYIMMFARNIFTINEKDRDKQISYLKRRVPPNYQGSDVYSVECNALVRNLLSYDKRNRLTGKNLRSHSFLNIPDPVLPPAETLLATAQDNINLAFSYAREKKHGEALVQGTEAIMKLKIHYNLISNAETEKHLKRKWVEYEEFTHDMQRALVQPVDMDLSCPENCNDLELRKYLVSTPKLLDGFDIGCDAEMFLKEGHRDKALILFHQALQMILPLMKLEPKSNRKKILGRRLKKWIEAVEALTGSKEPQPNMDQEQVTTAPATSTVSVEAAGIAYSLPSQD